MRSRCCRRGRGERCGGLGKGRGGTCKKLSSCGTCRPPCRWPASSTPGFSGGGWWGVGSEQLGLEWKALMAVLSVLAFACLIHVGM